MNTIPEILSTFKRLPSVERKALIKLLYKTIETFETNSYHVKQFPDC